MESLYLLIPLFFIILLIIPICFNVRIDIDGKKKRIDIILFILKIPVIKLKLLYKNNMIFLYINKKQQDLDIQLSVKQVYFINQFSTNLKDKIQIKYLDISSQIGLNDAYSTAMMCGTLNALIKTLFAFLKTKKYTATFDSKVVPKYNEDVFFIKSQICVKITIYELLYSVCVSLLSLRRRVYERSKK